MYLRKVFRKSSSWDSIFYRSQYLIRSSKNKFSYKKENNSYNSQLGQIVIQNFHSAISSQSKKWSSISKIPKFCGDYILDRSFILPRFYSSEGDKRSGGNTVPTKDTSLNVKKLQGTDVNPGISRRAKHAWLGEQDHNEWIKNEELAYNGQKIESTFLTKREKFRNGFMQKVIPWEKISVSWDTFPYYINKHTKKLLIECATSHLKCKQFSSSYGAHLNSSSGRILLQGIQGTELYRERIVRALACDLQVPLLVIDNSFYTSYGLNQEFDSDTEAYDEDAELGEEYSQSEVDEVSNEEDSEEVKSDESEEDNIDEQATAAVLEKLVPCIDEYAKRVSSEYETEANSAASLSKAINSAKKPDKTFRRGDRVKYVGSSPKVEANNRILLGKITTPDGPTNAYTYLSGRSLQNGQRGEVYEVNGDQVAVILDRVENNFRHEGKNEKITEQDVTPSLYWIDVQDIDHDSDLEAQGWYIAVEALCEVLSSSEPIIVYFPDSSQWLSGTVPRSRHKEFIQKLEEMFDELCGPIIFIYGKTKDISEPKQKKKLVVLSQFGRSGRLPVPLHRLAQALQGNGASKKKDNHNIINVFPNTLFCDPPEEEVENREFFEQLEVDKKYIITRNNLVLLRKVLDKHQLSCTNLLHVKTDGVIFTRQSKKLYFNSTALVARFLEAKQVAGWARNYYLSSCISPSINEDKLIIPQESFDTVISRLREWEDITKKPSQDLKNIAKDDYERNFISAVVPPSEIGVKFEDIGALEDVKKTLNELVTLPMRRPELFTRGNLLRPCKGILLFGPPGTGKTLLAKALATEAGANFISITGSTITSKWFGDAEKLTKALFSFASKLAPVIIFVDEVDSLLGARGGASEHESTRRMRNEFMAAWDGLRSKDSQRIIVLGATNRPFDLDDAVIRRLPRRIYVDLPNSENRIKILKIFLQQENIESSFRYDELANATDGYSGSDLKNLCIAAAYRPVQELLEEEKRGDGNKTASSLRSLNLNDFIQSKSKVGASVAYDASSMNDLRKWNEQYGEGGSRKRSPFGFGSSN